jgi:hypothetical protein
MAYESLDQCKVSSSGFSFGLGHHVPDYEAYGTEIEATDVLCGRGKTSFNHGKSVGTRSCKCTSESRTANANPLVVSTTQLETAASET